MNLYRKHNNLNERTKFILQQSLQKSKKADS